MGAADAADSLRLECPAGTGYVGGSCPELDLRSAGSAWLDSTSACAGAKLRLPSPQEVQDLQSEPGFQRVPVEWSGAIDGRDGATVFALAVTSGGLVATDPVSDLHGFRCVATPLR